MWRTVSRMVAAGLLDADTAAVVAAVGFSAVAVFQLALALGAPLGRAAWGGAQAHLPRQLRIASGIAVVFWLFSAAVILGRVGIEVVPLPDAVLRWGTWVLAVLLPIGVIMNFASRSPWERWIWGPVTLVIATCCVAVARSPWPPAGS